MNLRSLRAFEPPQGLHKLHVLRAELDHMTAVLLGHKEPPVDPSVDALLEVASTYLARALEIQMRLQRAEADGQIQKNSPWYRFRTGELRTFITLAQDAVSLGSRRVTVARLEQEQT